MKKKIVAGESEERKTVLSAEMRVLSFFQVYSYGAGIAFEAFEAGAVDWGALEKGAEGGFCQCQDGFRGDVEQVVVQGE